MKNSFITVTDQFCGAGGSSIGATQAGAEVKLAMNHLKLAIETHNTNFPKVDHECTDISAADPRTDREVERRPAVPSASKIAIRPAEDIGMSQLTYFLYNNIPGCWKGWTLAVLATGQADADAYVKAYNGGGKGTGTGV